MKTGILLSIIIFALVVLGDRPARADSAISTMAGVVMHLNHHPSDSEKMELKKIIDDKATPENERELASALMNMNHKVGDADKAKLDQMIGDKSTPADVREMADILVNIQHKPTADDQSRLKKLMQ